MLHLKPNAADAYDEAHRHVWPEMLALLKSVGISEYSIFRRGELLILSLHVEDDFETTWRRIENDPINLKWQQTMNAYFSHLDEKLQPGERFPMLREVFYLK